MGRMDGKAALVTGAARGIGRATAVRMAQEGADILAIDIAEDIAETKRIYSGATDADLDETGAQIRELGRRVVTAKADVRDYQALSAAIDGGVAELGHLDTVVACAGIYLAGVPTEQGSEHDWDTMMDINVKGVWLTCKATIPHLRHHHGDRSITLVSSAAGIMGIPNVASYAAAKHGVTGLMRSLARELGHEGIRVNSVHPCTTATPMVLNEATFALVAPGVENPTPEQVTPAFTAANTLPVPWIEPVDVANGILYLSSSEARFVTGMELKVDAGYTIK
jgi:SDR family mycofactocin-dependent oxidoreductase